MNSVSLGSQFDFIAPLYNHYLQQAHSQENNVTTEEMILAASAIVILILVALLAHSHRKRSNAERAKEHMLQDTHAIVDRCVLQLALSEPTPFDWRSPHKKQEMLEAVFGNIFPNRLYYETKNPLELEELHRELSKQLYDNQRHFCASREISFTRLPGLGSVIEVNDPDCMPLEVIIQGKTHALVYAESESTVGGIPISLSFIRVAIRDQELRTLEAA